MKLTKTTLVKLIKEEIAKVTEGHDGKAALSEEDRNYMTFANEFESRYISQGYYENRTVEQTLDLGWELLSVFEDNELKRIDEELIAKYMPQFRKK